MHSYNIHFRFEKFSSILFSNVSTNEHFDLQLEVYTSMITINVIFSFDKASVVELYLIEIIDIQGIKERNICILREYTVPE